MYIGDIADKLLWINSYMFKFKFEAKKYKFEVWVILFWMIKLFKKNTVDCYTTWLTLVKREAFVLIMANK